MFQLESPIAAMFCDCLIPFAYILFCDSLFPTLRAEISHIAMKNETKERPLRTAARSFEAAAVQKPGRTSLV